MYISIPLFQDNGARAETWGGLRGSMYVINEELFKLDYLFATVLNHSNHIEEQHTHSNNITKDLPLRHILLLLFAGAAE